MTPRMPRGGRMDLAIDAALAAVLDPATERASGERRLARLFSDLARTSSRARAGEIETLIWALWTNHADATLDAAMAEASRALAAFDIALRINPHLDGVARAAASLRKSIGAKGLN